MPRFLLPPEKGEKTLPSSPGTVSTRRLGLADVVWVARTALDRRKWLAAGAGLLAAALVYFLFGSVGNVIGSSLWRAILHYLGAALGYLVVVVTCFVLARMVQFEVRTGGVRTGVFETARYALRRLGYVCVTPGGVVLAALLALALMAVVAWIGGFVPTVFSFFFLLEFAFGAVVVAAAATLTWGLFLCPAILAADGTDELDTLRVVARLYRQHGLALAGYEVAALVLTWVAALVPGVVAVLALGCVQGLAHSAMGEALRWSAVRIPHVLQDIGGTWVLAVGGSLRWFCPGFGGLADALYQRLFNQPDGPRAHTVMYAFSGVFLGLSLLLIVVASLAYALVFFVAAGTRVYLAYVPPPPNPAAEQRAVA